MSAMEEEEDDLYGENGTTNDEPVTSAKTDNKVGDADDDEEEEMDEDDSDDSDIEIVTERKKGSAPAIMPGIVTQRNDATGQSSSAIPIVAPSQQAASMAAKVEYDSAGRAQVTVQSGLAYPPIRTSTIDVSADPIYPPVDKPITQVEIDADLVEHEKPWRRPGADQSDYFNYGFDEFTWSTYTLRQKTLGDAINEQKNETVQMEMMFGGGGGILPSMPPMPAMPIMPTMPPMPTMQTMPAMPDMSTMNSMPGMPAIPSQQDMQAAMMEVMRQTGETDVSKVDFNSVIAQLQAGGAGAGMMPQGNLSSGAAQNYGNNNWHGGLSGGGYRGNKRGGRWH